MKLVTERTRIREYIHYHRSLPKGMATWHPKGEYISSLNPETATLKDFEIYPMSAAYLKPKECCECGNLSSTVIEFQANKDSVYDHTYTAVVCLSCLNRAVSLIKGSE